MIGGRDTKVLNVNPLVVCIDGFLGAEECAGLIAPARERLEPATVVTEDARTVRSDARTNSTYVPRRADQQRLLPLLMKIGLALRMPPANAEPFAILHYSRAEEFKPHRDGFALDASPEKVAYYDRGGGQRLFTTMVYLNEVEAGGATAFPELGIRIEPAPGRLLIFANTAAGSRYMSNLALHAGEPVTAGEKWVAINWWRENAHQPESPAGEA